MGLLGREVRSEKKTRFEDHMPGRLHFNHFGLLDHLASVVNPPNVVPFSEFAFRRQAVVPVLALTRDESRPGGLNRNSQCDLSGTRFHEASRATVWTSFTPSSFSIRRESCASESISTVVETTAVLSSYTCTSSDDMFFRVSATTVAMSRSRPCRSQASILMATG